jgi:glycosyltransferase involved in cell wall biosynthesis
LAQLAPKPLRVWCGYAKASVNLARHFRSRPVELLHSNQTGCEESPIAARLAGIPIVVGTFHIDPTYDLHGARSSSTFRLVECLSNACLDRAIAVSRSAKKLWERRSLIRPRRVITIHNGIDPDRFGRRHSKIEARRALGLPLIGPVVGSLGRLDEAKGFRYLLEAAPLLLRKHPGLTVAIGGSGPLRESLERRADELGIGRAVCFTGFRTDVQVFYDAIDLFILPSVCETLGYVLLEAMACRLPVIGTRVGGIPEVIREGHTGWLVRPRDPEAIARAADMLLDADGLRIRFGQEGCRRVVETFHEKEMVRRTIDIYRELLQPGRRHWPASVNGELSL